MTGISLSNLFGGTSAVKAGVDVPHTAADAEQLDSEFLHVKPYKDGFSGSPLLWGGMFGMLGASIGLLNGGEALDKRFMLGSAIVVGGIAAGITLLTKLDNPSSRTLNVDGAMGVAELQEQRPDLAKAVQAELEASGMKDASGIADELLETFDANGDGSIGSDERSGTSDNGVQVRLDTGWGGLGVADDATLTRQQLILAAGASTPIKVDQEGFGDLYVNVRGYTDKSVSDFVTRD